MRGTGSGDRSGVARLDGSAAPDDERPAERLTEVGERLEQEAEPRRGAGQARAISAAPSTIRTRRGTTSSTLSRAQKAMSSSSPGGP